MNELNVAKIRWACRRGMMELDILLMDFFDQQFSELTEAQQHDFVALLQYPDPELYAYLMGQGSVEKQSVQNLVERIREYHRQHQA